MNFTKSYILNFVFLIKIILQYGLERVVAQLVEHSIRDAEVVGSSPANPTIKQ
jgi:hypothetical protein